MLRLFFFFFPFFKTSIARNWEYSVVIVEPPSWGAQVIILLNLISFFSVTEPINSYILIKHHNKTIKWINDNNPETLRNYQVHNPLVENNENVSNSNVVRTSNNVLYESLNTDSSESEESNDNIQALNIVIEN